VHFTYWLAFKIFLIIHSLFIEVDSVFSVEREFNYLFYISSCLYSVTCCSVQAFYALTVITVAVCVLNIKCSQFLNIKCGQQTVLRCVSTF